MPAVTPAEVAIGPSRTKIGSGSTWTSGYRRANVPQTRQWVVARRPASSPAGQDERPAAHRHDPPRPFGVRPEPSHDHRIGVPGALSAGHDHGVRRRHGRQVRIGHQGEAARRAYRRAAGAGGHHPVRRAGARENLQRAGHVETLHTREQQDQNVAAGHADQPAAWRRWQQRRRSHLFCHTPTDSDHGRLPWGMTRFSGLDDLLATEHLGTSAWHLVDQARIDAFAQVTGDRQWIHVDPERAARESPFGTTIAHGALTLSLCLTFLTEVLHVDGVAFVVNGGFDRVRFHTPVRAGSRLRGVISLVQARRTSGGARIVVRTRAEIDGDKRPACLADHILGLR